MGAPLHEGGKGARIEGGSGHQVSGEGERVGLHVWRCDYVAMHVCGYVVIHVCGCMCMAVWLCMCGCVAVHVCVALWLCMCVAVHVCGCACVWLCMCGCGCACVAVAVHVCGCGYACVWLCMCGCVAMHVCGCVAVTVHVDGCGCVLFLIPPSSLCVVLSCVPSPPLSGPSGLVTPILGGIVEMVKDPWTFWERQRLYSFPGMSWNRWGAGRGEGGGIGRGPSWVSSPCL